MDQSEPEIRHLGIHRVLQCAKDPDTSVRFLDLQTESGLVRMHCDVNVWHALLKTLEDYEAQESSDSELMAVPSILRFLNNTQKGSAV